MSSLQSSGSLPFDISDLTVAMFKCYDFAVYLISMLHLESAVVSEEALVGAYNSGVKHNGR